MTAIHRSAYRDHRDPSRSLEQACKELGRRNPLADNEDLETDIGTYGRDDIDATLPLIQRAIPLVEEWKKELLAFQGRAAKNGRAGKAAFNDPVEWLGDALEDLESTQRAFADALRADEERG